MLSACVCINFIRKIVISQTLKKKQKGIKVLGFFFIIIPKMYC